MGLFSRFWLLYRMRTTAALNRAEDPRETLDYAHEQLQTMLAQVRRGLVEVAATRRQLDAQAARLRVRIPELDEQARRALAMGREDLARLALERRETTTHELGDLERQLAEVAAEEQRLTAAQGTFAARLEEFRVRRQIVSASYTAAEAQVRAREAMAGVSDELTELGLAVGRAEEQTERMRARALALDALIDTGGLDLPLGREDAVERELRRASSERAVEERLAALKQGLAQEPPPTA